jgi:STE24 endopeptidase
MHPSAPNPHTPDAPDPDWLSAGELAEARRYRRARLACQLAEMALTPAWLAVATVFAARPLDSWLARWFSAETARVALMATVVSVAHGMLVLPLAFYSGFVLEHRHRLSRQSLGAWAWRGAKQAGLGLVFEVPLLVGLYWLVWTVGGLWWLAAAGAFFAVSVLLGQLAPVVILPLFYKVEPLDDPALAARLARIAQGGGLALAGVFRIRLSEETAKANAMLAGLGRTRRVLLGDTLLGAFSPEEIEVVFAHEVAHHVHRHIAKMIAAGAAASALAFAICDRVLAAWVERGGGAYDPARLPAETVPLLMLSVTVLSTLAGPVANAVSRRFERQCDRYALAETGNRPAFESAFRKLARINKADPAPPRWEVLLFHSHPSIAERLALAGEGRILHKSPPCP